MPSHGHKKGVLAMVLLFAVIFHQPDGDYRNILT